MEPQLLLPRPSLHDNDQEDSCEICYDYPDKWQILPCTHKLCNQCYTKLQGNSCPWCRTPLGNSRLGPEEVLPTNSNLLTILDIDQPELSRRRTRRRRNRINYSLEDDTDFDIRRLRSESDPGPQYTVRHELNTPEEVINYEREAVRRIDSRRRAARREKINVERDHPGNRKHQHGRRDILSRLRSPIAVARNAATRNTRGL